MKSVRYEEYDVYENGQIFSHYRHRFLKPDITKQGYEQVSLYINGHVNRIKVHRLVAMLFIPNPNGYTIINHKDGDKRNNHYSNLEWCDYTWNNRHARIMGLNNVSETNKKRWEDESFKARVSQNISSGLLKSEKCKGENNPRFRYRIYYQGVVVSRKDLSRILNLSQSYTDSLIFQAANHLEIKLFSMNNIEVIDTKHEGQSTIESYKSIRTEYFSGVEDKAG